jgi:hypothetical protein
MSGGIEIHDEKGVDLSRPPRGFSEVLPIIIQLKQANEQTQIRKILQDQTSKGFVEQYTLQATSQQPVIEMRPSQPARSFNLDNDGPGQVFVEVNHRFQSPATLNPGERYNIKFDSHQLYRFWVYCLNGATASVRVNIEG